ncbi:MAG TPA: cohesin domain-containing protein [Blastocatellia bacterium]|nr:cohesin domain-containing protein [Blastocatellia bacterium]HMX25538.1 cohesin domain-containing protein [Blastocatellia bacterium]HMZ21343.1 cohesin domain-containing protein [Blastocatellia bacterium]HNG30166.1 cohesin domain-containing protein [Blastocatellia bacterium]
MNTNISIRRFLALFLTLCLILPGTALAGGGKGKKNFNEGKKYEASQQWDMAAQAYALAVSAEPDNPEYRLHYMRALQQASLMYLKRGDSLADQNDFAGAYTAYRTAFNYDQGNEVARIKMERMLDQQKAIANGLEPINYTNSGNVKPTGDIQIASKPRNRDLLQNVEFKEANFKAVVKNLAKQLDLNVLFDDQVKDDKVSVDMNDVTLAKALDNILFMKKYTFEQMDRRTIIVYQDNPTNKPRFEKLMVKAFYLGNINANQARGVINLALGAGRQVQALDQNAGGPGGGSSGGGGNIVLVKATPQELQVVQQILEMVDKNKNEVVLDVDIYEVSHDSMLQLGNQIATSPQDVFTAALDSSGKPIRDKDNNLVFDKKSTTSLTNLGGLGANPIAGTISLLGGASTGASFLGLGALLGVPPTTLSLLQSKGKSKLLNKTQIHVLDGQSNTTKVGRSVPVRLGTQYGFNGFGGAGIGTGGIGTGGIGTGGIGTGGIGTGIGTGLGSGFGGYPGIDSIQYRDVGLVIEATPTITNEGYVEVKMKFETSDVAASGSTANLTPEFTQRSLQTVARIKDGVTSVVAGVNQESRGDARSGIPVLGMVPILGRFFTTPKQDTRQSDIVITVTPHIVRSAGITQKDYLAIYAGGNNAAGGGLPPSVEDVVYRAQLEEEQERRLIAMNGTTQQNIPLTPDNQSANTQLVSNPGGQSVPSRQVQQPQQSGGSRVPPPMIQPVGNTNSSVPPRRFDNNSLTPVNSPSTLSSGAPVVQPQLEQGSVEIQPTEISANNGGGAVKEGEVPKEGEVIKPENPVQVATIASGQDSEERRIKMAQFKKQYEAEQKRAEEEAKAASKRQNRIESAPAPIPEGINSPKGKVSQAIPAMGGRSNIGFTLSAPNRQQVGKTFSVFVEVSGQGQMTGATLAIRFDETKLKVKSVRGGELFGEDSSLKQNVEKGILTASIRNKQKSPVSANGRVLVIEFSALSEGSTEIAFNNSDTKINLSETMNVPANGRAAQLVISRDAVATSTNER